jgi:hypothetical protein
MYNVTLRRFRATFVAAEKAVSIIYPECVFLTLACNARAPYCHLWPVRPYNIFPHYLISGTIFERRKLLNVKFML